MQIRSKWLVGFGLAATSVIAAWVAAVCWLPSDKELAIWLAAEASERLGVELTIGSVHWELLPEPVIVVIDFRTQQLQPVVIQRIKAYPGLRMLLDRKLRFERVDIDTAVFPRNSVRALQMRPGAKEDDVNDVVPLEHLRFRSLTWISYSGIPLAYDGEIDFAPHWRPWRAELRRPGITPAFTLTLTREAEADRWQTRIQIGGGTAHGKAELKTAANGAMHLSGQLAPQAIEVASALASFGRRSPVAGHGVGQTTFMADGHSLAELTRSLHTHTVFSVNGATLLRFDLNEAIRTAGTSHHGQTGLQALSGVMDTQNGDEGTRVTLTDIKARTGKFSAAGKATVYHGQVEASGKLNLLEGAISVPFSVSGPVVKPNISVAPGFMAGAAIGTAVLPGIGTVIGARVGSAVGEIFRSSAEQPVAPSKGAVQR